MPDGGCKICGATDLHVFAHTAKCGECGVLLFWPYPKSDSELVQGGEGKEWSQDEVLNWYSRASFRNHSNFTNILRFTTDESFRGRRLDILDYGGGGGQFALVCRSHFPEATVYFTDISDVSLLEQWKSFNVQIPFAQFSRDPRRFDLIFLNDVFEHLSDPIGVLEELSAKLKPTGRIFIDTPKQFWIYPLSKLFSKGLYTKVLQGTVTKAHLQIWSRQSFKLAVHKSGLLISQYLEKSEYTMPAEYYLNNMGLQRRGIRFLGGLFYRNARLLARNKIFCILSLGEASPKLAVRT